jgi:hypothetical protein
VSIECTLPEIYTLLNSITFILNISLFKIINDISDISLSPLVINMFCVFSEVIECQEPIEVVSYKIGVCKVSPKGKTCTTTFQKLGYNGKTSVISCKPHTGRMHQIRVHLQYLGEHVLAVEINIFSVGSTYATSSHVHLSCQ